MTDTHPRLQVQLISGRHVLPDDVTLMDLSYMGYMGQVRRLVMSLKEEYFNLCLFNLGFLGLSRNTESCFMVSLRA